MQKTVKHINALQYLGKVIRSNPLEILRLIRTALRTFQYRYIYRCIKEKTVVGNMTEIIDSSNVTIGAHCLLLDHVYIRAGTQGEISVGDYCAINSFTKLFGHGGIEVGAYSQIGPNCLLTTTAHDYKKGLLTSFKKITIGEHVWIGAQSIILPGIIIGSHSVIGAGSVVTKDIPEYSLAVGNPAKVIKNLK